MPQIDETASPLQQANWRLAVQEFEANREILTAKPLRYYVNFGFACNLSCIQCHQVPRRKTNGRQVSSDVLYNWREHFKSALEVGVIGGEPFALAEALKFIRRFVEDDELKDVRLKIFTNGTLHHRHMEILRKKRKLSLIVSMDGIGDAYDHIRVGGKWSQVEENVLDFIEAGKRLNLEWDVAAWCGLMKTAIPKLPDLAKWHGRHNIPARFFEVISARGVEKAVADENVLANPLLVRQIPGWKDYFTEAASVYRRYNMEYLAGSMEYFRDRIEKRLQAVVFAEETLGASPKSNGWTTLFDQGVHQLATLSACLYGNVSQPPVVRQKRWWPRDQHLIFKPTHLNDHLASEFVDLPAGASGDLCVRMTWWWPSGFPESERCIVNFQDQSFAGKWEVDFERDLAGGVVQRHIILNEKSKQFRLMLCAPEMQQAVLPKRVKIEFRREAHVPVGRGREELLQIASAAN
jgi:hypothetical protein